LKKKGNMEDNPQPSTSKGFAKAMPEESGRVRTLRSGRQVALDQPMPKKRKVASGPMQAEVEAVAPAADNDAAAAVAPAAAVEEEDHRMGDIFLERETVAENDKFELKIMKRAFQRNRRFDLVDMLFELKALAKPGQRGLLVSELRNVLYTGLVNVLKRLQDHFANPEHQYQVYVTIVDSAILNGLNTGL
jgi:hypothetical protein